MNSTNWLRLAGAASLVAAFALVTAPIARAEEQKAPPAKEQEKASKPKPAPAKSAAAKPAAKSAGASKKPTASDDGPVTITNEDLERMFGPPEPAPEPEAGARPAGGPDAAAKPDAAKQPSPTDDPLKAMEEEKQKAAERRERIATAQRALADAEANLKSLESRLLATKNPYLPRPKLTDEEAKQQEGLDAAQRVEQNEKQIEDARNAVERLRAELAQAQAGR